jgi:hypothetical protein
MIMYYTHGEYCGMPSTLCTCNIRVGTAARYVILTEVIQTLMCFDDRSSVSVRQEMQHVNTGRLRTLTNEDAITAAVERVLQRGYKP